MGKTNYTSKSKARIVIESEGGVYRLMYHNTRTGKMEVLRINSSERQEFPQIW